MAELRDYTAYGISTFLVLSSVVLYFIFNKKTDTIEQQLKIQLDQYEKEYSKYVLEVEAYYKKEFDNLEDKKYHCNYYQEELLKLLIKLDGVDLLSVEDEEKRSKLKLIRKGLIKQIQLKQKELDQYLKQI